jgi:aspartate/methionine/tyrosine aminotransferase
MHLLEDGLVATVPGSAFGKHGEGYLRLAYSNSQANIEEAMERMEQSVIRLCRTRRDPHFTGLWARSYFLTP